MFPNAHLSIYSYQGLLDAAAAYPAFGGSGTTDQQKREIAAFLANVAHETGDLQYADEIAKADYCQSSSSCPCEPGQQYFGRGALQLSWNYNYCAAGDALGVDLRKNPGQISTSPKLIWLTGMWFWMTSTGAGNQTCHDGIASSGFGATIKTINGGLECGGQNAGSAQDRVTHYQKFCQLLGVDPGSNFTC
jgi:chitinase